MSYLILTSGMMALLATLTAAVPKVGGHAHTTACVIAVCSGVATMALLHLDAGRWFNSLALADLGVALALLVILFPLRGLAGDVFATLRFSAWAKRRAEVKGSPPTLPPTQGGCRNGD
jgi:hypothetical protein